MRSHSYLNTAEKILIQYKGEQPFAAFIKNYFSANKKSGSRDRKQIAHLCYCFFRLGKASREAPVQERILLGLFLCSAEPNEVLKEIRPEWNARVSGPIAEKVLNVNDSFLIRDVFPWPAALSEHINYQKFCESFFIQPDLYLRIRPGHAQKAKAKIVNAGIQFKEIGPDCLAFSNATKIENVIELDKEAVVQDLSSQQIGQYLELPADSYREANRLSKPFGKPFSAWDCCAGSGGKSLLLYDVIPNVDLTVSDIRTSILVNLKKRFARAGIKKYRAFVTDLSNLHSALTSRSQSGRDSLFDLIICDAPCTGSGTWSRTPEQLYFFEESKIDYYALLQRRISSAVIPLLKPGGFLLYITCSVFKEENEGVMDFIAKQFPLQVIKAGLLKGYEKKADSMFVALLQKRL